jgi:hypothetical protein
VSVGPDFRAGRRVDRVGGQMRGHIEEAVVDDRPGREGGDLAEPERADWVQPGRIVCVDLVEPRIALVAISLVVHQPGVGRAVRCVELGLGRSAARGLEHGTVKRSDHDPRRLPLDRSLRGVWRSRLLGDCAAIGRNKGGRRHSNCEGAISGTRSHRTPQPPRNEPVLERWRARWWISVWPCSDVYRRSDMFLR